MAQTRIENGKKQKHTNAYVPKITNAHAHAQKNFVVAVFYCSLLLQVYHNNPGANPTTFEFATTTPAL
jgi:hypothetical protein